jgi:hypothetical protein
MKRSTKIRFITTRGFHAVLPCRAATVPPDPQLCGRDHPPPPGLDRVVLAEAEPRPAGPFSPGLPGQRRDVRRSGRRVRDGYLNGLAVCGGNRRATGHPCPKLRKAVREAKKAGYAYVALDGTLIPIDRVAADRPFYSGKHRRHGMNLQVITSPQGISSGSPGRCPEPSTTQRPHGSGASCASWRPPAWSPSPTGATRAPRTPERRTRGRTSPNPKTSQPSPRQAPLTPRTCERANAQLKTWRILRKLRCCPWRAGQLAKAIHVLQIREAKRRMKKAQWFSCG